MWQSFGGRGRWENMVNRCPGKIRLRRSYLSWALNDKKEPKIWEQSISGRGTECHGPSHGNKPGLVEGQREGQGGCHTSDKNPVIQAEIKKKGRNSRPWRSWEELWVLSEVSCKPLEVFWQGDNVMWPSFYEAHPDDQVWGLGWVKVGVNQSSLDRDWWLVPMEMEQKRKYGIWFSDCVVNKQVSNNTLPGNLCSIYGIFLFKTEIPLEWALCWHFIPHPPSHVAQLWTRGMCWNCTLID